ncbi:reverse transcriptase/maturase family protein [Levilinea saccharolytica]|nr:reverse transcriptase/maturase family protein [Levilinea saccharolytica]GAP18544.1 retron-type reverse transcriptase [Levilinea saccharolytica]
MSFRAARKGKRAQSSVAAFERNLEEELLRLEDELRAKTYRPGPYRSFYRTEAKRRLISAAPFRDRVVHHALIAIIEPLFERRFIFDSYANRKGKGTHRALDRCTHFLRAGGYSLQCDIRQFFPSIDHAILMRELNRVISDQEVISLCERILETGQGVLDEMYEMRWFPGDNLLSAARPRGLPLGNLTSQFWANVYLNPLDHFIKRSLKCTRYLRYVDDFVLFSEDKAQLHQWKSEIILFLDNLRLTLHETAAPVRPVPEGLPFLGFILYPNYRRLKPRTGHAFRRRFGTLIRQYQCGQVDLPRLTASAQGWAAHANHGDTYGLRRLILGVNPIRLMER